MKILVFAATLLGLLLMGDANAYQISREEVVFRREYREYGWKKYSANAVKLPHPMQILVDFYLVEYRLNAEHLIITRTSAAHPPTRIVLATTSLNQRQRQAVRQALRTANPILLEQQCNNNSVVIDDGFQLAVTLTKPTVSRSFNWHGNYVPDLLTLLELVNESAPKKYQFYELGQQEAFKQSLLQVTNAP